MTSNNITNQINQLINEINSVELKINTIMEEIIQKYKHVSSLMDQTQNYFLAGIQLGIPSKSYLLTARGIEVLGEDPTPIEKFIDEVIKFANHPVKKLTVLLELDNHLQKIHESIPINEQNQL